MRYRSVVGAEEDERRSGEEDMEQLVFIRGDRHFTLSKIRSRFQVTSSNRQVTVYVAK
jgi:hypothetical protein